MSNSIMHLANSNHAPVGLSDISADDQYCDYPTGRGRRYDSLESLRYIVQTTQDLVDAIKNHNFSGGPRPDDLILKVSFAEMAIARVRGGAMRKLAEKAQTPTAAQSTPNKFVARNREDAACQFAASIGATHFHNCTNDPDKWQIGQSVYLVQPTAAHEVAQSRWTPPVVLPVPYTVTLVAQS